jgi:hypothetical protein
MLLVLANSSSQGSLLLQPDFGIRNLDLGLNHIEKTLVSSPGCFPVVQASLSMELEHGHYLAE